MAQCNLPTCEAVKATCTKTVGVVVDELTKNQPEFVKPETGCACTDLLSVFKQYLKKYGAVGTFLIFYAFFLVVFVGTKRGLEERFQPFYINWAIVPVIKNAVNQYVSFFYLRSPMSTVEGKTEFAESPRFQQAYDLAMTHEFNCVCPVDVDIKPLGDMIRYIPETVKKNVTRMTAAYGAKTNKD